MYSLSGRGGEVGGGGWEVGGGERRNSTPVQFQLFMVRSAYEVRSEKLTGDLVFARIRALRSFSEPLDRSEGYSFQSSIQKGNWLQQLN